MKKHFLWILFWFSTCGLVQSAENPPPAQNYPCRVRTITIQAGETEHSILIAAGFKDVLVSISRHHNLPPDPGATNKGKLVINWGDSRATMGQADNKQDINLHDKWFITARWINAVVTPTGAGSDATIEYCVIATAG
jgi:hypothetical protein